MLVKTLLLIGCGKNFNAIMYVYLQFKGIMLIKPKFFQAGALLACGIVNSGVRNECDPALALLSDYVVHTSSTMRTGAIVG